MFRASDRAASLSATERCPASPGQQIKIQKYAKLQICEEDMQVTCKSVSRFFVLQAASIADEVLKTEYDAARILFNRFHSAISFKPTITTVLSPDVRDSALKS